MRRTSSNILTNIRQAALIALPALLLPVFYITHLAVAQLDLISSRDYRYALGWHIFGAAVVLLICRLVLRRLEPAAILTFLLTGFFLFWGYLADIIGRFLKHFPLWGGWWQLLGVSIAIVVFYFLLEKARRSVGNRLFRFLNLLLMLWIAVDVAKALLQPKPAEASEQYRQIGALPTSQPDVYFLLLDEFAGTATVKALLRYDNSSLDSFLRNRGFFVARNSRSNYNATIFSVASLLNMNYLPVTPSRALGVEEYRLACNLIGRSEVIREFWKQGYNIVNNSIFNLEHAPAQIPEIRFPVRDRIFNANNFWHGFVIRQSYRNRKNALAAQILRWHERSAHANDEQLWKRTMHAIAGGQKPKFVYAHLMWLHSEVYNELEDRFPQGMEAVPDMPKQETREYAYSLRYAQRQLRPFVDSVLRANSGNAVVVLMGDHGKRGITAPGAAADFANYCAVYMPRHNYQQLYDSISAVNVFRAVLNGVMPTNHPLLPDSTVAVRY